MIVIIVIVVMTIVTVMMRVRARGRGRRASVRIPQVCGTEFMEGNCTGLVTATL